MRKTKRGYRADGQPTGLTLERMWPWIVGVDHQAPTRNSAHRTRSLRWLAGTRRTKRIMRKAAGRG